ncbi:MAG TPA: hypothetical protein VK487_08250 [Candidatus Bathyarchaeia archaeon]|nr:hypothetical protein [Candidatus Bathyarchaeia archaeon]
MTIQISEFAPERHLTAMAELLNNEYRDSFEFIPFDGERIKYQIRRRNMSVLVAEENGHGTGLTGLILRSAARWTFPGSPLEKDLTERELKICSWTRLREKPRATPCQQALRKEARESKIGSKEAIL